ncbi:hypothetical protein TRAPUB_5492 [Trametes pubescens]|uniref:Uncharacterized protein n=1 Tax=Trametes pubescens TaxID=154538 RepID=A0A1M2W723_TRAPU|nr:hypothetical protein TRAPUB_5492 [Trametes pubescens]
MRPRWATPSSGRPNLPARASPVLRCGAEGEAGLTHLRAKCLGEEDAGARALALGRRRKARPRGLDSPSSSRDVGSVLHPALLGHPSRRFKFKKGVQDAARVHGGRSCGHDKMPLRPSILPLLAKL